MASLMKLNDMETLQEVLAHLASKSEDLQVPLKDVADITAKTFTIPQVGVVNLTDKSAGQLSARYGIPATVFQWVRDNQPDYIPELIGKQRKRLSHTELNKKALLRLRTHEDKVAARAVLSDRYGIIDNKQLVQAFMNQYTAKFGPAGDLKPTVWLDTLTGSLQCQGLFDKYDRLGDKDPHTVGFLISNDETGAGSAKLDTVFTRLYCTNQFAALGVGEGDAKRRHVGGVGELHTLNHTMAGWLNQQVEAIRGSFEQYYNLREKKLKDPGKTLAGLRTMTGITAKEMEGIVKDILPKYLAHDGYTAYAVVNSLTEFARDLENQAKQTMVHRAVGRVIAHI